MWRVHENTFSRADQLWNNEVLNYLIMGNQFNYEKASSFVDRLSRFIKQIEYAEIF